MTATVLALLAVMLLVLGVTTDLVLRARLEGQLEQRLQDRASVASALVDTVGSDELVRRLEGDGVSVRLETSLGEVITAGPQMSVAGKPVGSSRTPAPKRRGRAAKEEPVSRTGDLLQISRQLSDGSTITLYADAADVRRTLRQVLIALFIGALGVLAAAAAILGPVIGRAMRPLDRINATARSITAGDRGRRLHPDRPETELGRTATAFDDMLDAVEGAETQARDAENRMRAFLSDAAHELRTPLTGIRAAAEHLVRADPDRAEREQLTVTVVREASRAARLVDDMLTMAQIDRGLELALEPTDLHALAETLVATKQLSAPDAQITVHGSGVVATVDPDRITQVLANLVDNASNAAGPGASVQIVVGHHSGSAFVDVTDDGPGIPPENAERIFERLVRFDDSRSRRQGGAGLGLSIARGIARAHGGDLVYLPRSGRTGACFRLLLPDGEDQAGPRE
ncbi:MAG: HAMP domain-containing histidine kinase [Kineosporiaceae bacterium]|nr:HAMP domain-containing histidine kinase [Aeromicrobium sp.]